MNMNSMMTFNNNNNDNVYTMFFMFTISYLCKERQEERDKIIFIMSFMPNLCTCEVNRTCCP